MMSTFLFSDKKTGEIAGDIYLFIENLRARLMMLTFDGWLLGSLEIVGLPVSLFLVVVLTSMDEIKNHQAKQSQRTRALPCLAQS